MADTVDNQEAGLDELISRVLGGQGGTDMLIATIDRLVGGDGTGDLLARMAAEQGLCDDRPVHPFKKLLSNEEMAALGDTVKGWVSNLDYMDQSHRFSVFSAFHAGRMHERGYRPGDNPDEPPPAR